MNQEDRIIVTGAAGFIGSYCSHALLKLGFKVLGIDNLNNYYDVKLKHHRLSSLSENNNFSFQEVDLIEFSKVKSSFGPYKFDGIIEIALKPCCVL